MAVLFNTFKGLPEITDSVIEKVTSNCRGLRVINVGDCTNLTDASMNSIAKHCEFLKAANVKRTKISLNGIHTLVKNSSGLTDLDISVTDMKDSILNLKVVS